LLMTMSLYIWKWFALDSTMWGEEWGPRKPQKALAN